MKHSFFTLLMIGFASLVLTSCQSKEERAISKIQTIAEKIKDRGDKLSSEDLEALMDDFEKIHDEISNGDYNFNSEQLEQLAEAEGEVVGAAIEKGAKEAGKALKDAIKVGTGFIKGLTGED